MTDLTELGVKALRDGIATGDFTAREAAEAFNAAVEQASALNAFIVTTPDHALAAADAIDAKRAKGEDLGKMGGVPIGMKDLFCTDGVQTTAASHILEGFVPRYESTVSQKLWEAGAGMLGKLNLDQFAMGSSNETSYFGNVSSPWRKEGSNAAMSPGGSSGGRCSRWGVVAFASSLDQAGPMARSVEDCAIMLEAMAGFDPKDATSLQMDVPNWEDALDADLKGKRIGIPREYRMDGTDAEILDSWEQGKEWLRDAGAEIVDISLPHTKYALPAYYIIAPAEASSNLARYDGVRYGLRDLPDGAGLQDMYAATRADGFGDEVKRRILIGTYVLSAGFCVVLANATQGVRVAIDDQN